MKWATVILSLGFIASNAYAAPAAGLDLFKLKVTSSAKELDGRYLASNASTLGLYDSEDISAVRVYRTSSEKKGCSQLHTYPIGIVDHALALVGSDGLMALKDMVNPSGSKPEAGLVMQWDTFRITDSKLTNDGKGTWVAFPSTENGWAVKWTDGNAFMTTDYMPVEIVMEAAGEGRYNEK
jgi:hypothetical protein